MGASGRPVADTHGLGAHRDLTAGVGDNDLFNIDAGGHVTFKASPNFEAPADAGADNTYDIVVTASDGLPAHNATRNVAITVTDVSNTPLATANFVVCSHNAKTCP